MKALSLWAPWSNLVAEDSKRIETRSYHTNYRGLLAIHSAKKWDDETKPYARAFRDGLKGADCKATLGMIICFVDLVDCRVINPEMSMKLGSLDSVYMRPPKEPEYSYGNYETGRYGWIFKNVFKLKRPIPITGRQRIFNVPLEPCDMCDGTGLMEGWNRRDGHSCPTCWGDCRILAA